MSAPVLVDCGKCGGTGNIRAYGNILGGVCFRCKGAGKVKYRKPRQPKVIGWKPGKDQSDRYFWEDRPDGMMAIYGRWHGFWCFTTDGMQYKVYEGLNKDYWGAGTLEKAQDAAERFNRGERWEPY